MTWVSGGRVKETTITTGLGDVALLGAVTGFRAFSAIAANGDTVFYVIASLTEWEEGYGTWVTGNTLQRTRVRSSSNGGALVNFSAGAKDVWCDFPGDHGTQHPQIRTQTDDRFIPPDASVVVADRYEIAVGKTLEIGVGGTLEIT